MRRLLIAILALSLFIFPTPVSAHVSPDFTYVALGDSVAAGVGLPSPETTAEGQACGRTAYAYPNYLAQSLGAPVRNLACSGAKVNDGFRAEREDNSVLGAQLRPAFTNGTPDLITVTAGANDARWSGFLRDCYSWRCGSKFDDWRFTQLYIPDLRFELRQLLSQIDRYSQGQSPKVLLNGYYEPFDNADCREARGITAQEVAWLNARTYDVNRTIREVANEYAFAEYVPINFDGHELCSDQPWIQGRASLQRFHPTIEGQQAIAQANLRAYRGTD